MVPVSKRARVGSGSEEAHQEPEECCVCFNEFEEQGPRTKIRPFSCSDGVAHPICRACDRTLFMRNDDKCPTCRAPRSLLSIQAGGWREPPAPVEPPIMMSGLGGTMFFPVDSDSGEPDLFIGLAPQRFFAMSGGAPSDMAVALTRGFHAAVSSRNSRSSHPALARDSAADVSEETDGRPDTSGDAALAAAMSDPGIAAAIEGLNNPAAMDIGTFLRTVRGASASAPGPQARRRHPHVHPAMAMVDESTGLAANPAYQRL